MKTLIKNVSIAILFASFLFSCSKENVIESLEPPANSVSLNPAMYAAHYDEFIINDRAYVPCGNNGKGEWVSITGKGKLNPHASGLIQSQIALSELNVTGENSGEWYSFNESRVFTINNHKQFHLFDFSNRGNSVDLLISVLDQNVNGTLVHVSLVNITC